MTRREDIYVHEMSDRYYGQSRGLIEGGADLLLIETSFDTRNVKSAVLAIQRLERELGTRIPTIISGTIERWGAMLAGQPADAFYASFSHLDLFAIVLNCPT